jgi:hypothetical protein
MFSYYDSNGRSPAAIYQDNEGDTIRLTSDVHGKAYGAGNDFDFQRDTMTEACEQLRAWGYKYVGEE